MNRHYNVVLAAVLGLSLGLLGCGGSGPVGPEEAEVTTLSVETDAALTDDDPSGLVNVAVWPHEAGGWLSIEVCVGSNGHPVAADPGGDLTCESHAGHWEVAFDQDGEPWISRNWPGWAVVRFDRDAGQAPMLFRASYEAPRGGRTASVRDCRWLLAEMSDVGVACSSSDGSRPLPLVTPDGSPTRAD